MSKNIIEPDDVKTQVFDWGTIKWLSEVAGAERFSAGVVIIEPGKGHLKHTHSGVEEILYVISGKGNQMVAGEQKIITAGMLVHISPGVEHETINIGWEPLKLLAVYSPSGPEKELGKSAECRTIPAGEIPKK